MLRNTTLFLCLSAAACPSLAAQDLDQVHLLDSSNYMPVDAGWNRDYIQVVTCEVAGRLSRIELALGQFFGDGDIALEIRRCDASGAPLGDTSALLGTTTFPTSSISTPLLGTQIEVEHLGIEVSAQQQIALLIQVPQNMRITWGQGADPAGQPYDGGWQWFRDLSGGLNPWGTVGFGFRTWVERFPGSGDDIDLEVSVNGIEAADAYESIQRGDVLEFRVTSPNDAFTDRPWFVVGQVFPFGATIQPVPGLPNLYVPAGAGEPFWFFSGLGGPFGNLGLPAGGASVRFSIPFAVPGVSMIVQAFGGEIGAGTIGTTRARVLRVPDPS